MATELVKITADLFESGAVISAPMTKWLRGWNTFGSRRIIYPTGEFLRTYEDGISIAMAHFVHLRITAIGTSMPASLFDGEFDFLMADNRLDWLLGENLPRMVKKAMENFKVLDRRALCGWLELWEVDGSKGTAYFVTDQVEISRLIHNL